MTKLNKQKKSLDFLLKSHSFVRFKNIHIIKIFLKKGVKIVQKVDQHHHPFLSSVVRTSLLVIFCPLRVEMIKQNHSTLPAVTTSNPRRLL